MPVEPLEIIIKGDVVQVTKSLDELTAEFKELEKQLKTKTGKAFVDANKELDKLRQTMDKVKNIGRSGFDKFGDAAEGAGKGIKKVGQAANDAAPALNSMSQVARDLPFGFIAIQNNLPIMADQFTNLIKTSKGLGGALKSLGAAMLGPAGVTFAIGAVISLVTGLINKYGSLGNAIEEIFKLETKHAKLMKEVAEVNKAAGEAAGTEIARFRFLADTMQNTALAMDVRTDAMKKMKDEYGIYLQNMKDEDLLNGDLEKSTKDVTDALIAKAVATAAVAKAGTLSGQIAANALQDEQDLQEIKRLERLAEKQAATSQGKAETSGAAGTRREIEQLKAVIVTRQKENKLLEDQITFFLNLAQAKNKAAGAGAISEDSPEERARKKAADDAKIKADQDKADRDRLAALKKLQDIEKGRLQAQLKGLDDEMKKVDQLSKTYLRMAMQRIDIEEKLALVGETDPQTIQQIKNNASNARAAIMTQMKQLERDAGKIPFTSIFELDEDEAVKRWIEFSRNVAKRAQQGGQAPLMPDIPKIPEQKKEIRLSDTASAAIQTLTAEMTLLKTKTDAAADAFNQVLAPAIDAAFDALEKGENIVQAVGKAMQKLIIQIAATVVKAAILAAILSVISGGSANAAKGGKSFGEFFSGMIKGLAQSKGSFGGAGAGFAGPAASALTPSFAGFGGGMAIQITGELTGRGTDLVATLDNANARIRRTG